MLKRWVRFWEISCDTWCQYFANSRRASGELGSAGLGEAGAAEITALTRLSFLAKGESVGEPDCGRWPLGSRSCGVTAPDQQDSDGAYCMLEIRHHVPQEARRSAEDWLQRVAKIIAQPGTQEADMAPKAARNFGDKGEGARITRAGKDSGDAGFTGRRPVSGVTQRDEESASSAAESTVRQQREQRRSTKIQTGLTGGEEPAGQSTKVLKWDYLGIRLTGSENAPASDSPPNVDGNVDGQIPNTSTTSTDTRLLQIIYDMIKEVQTETRAESRWARIATKNLQGAVQTITKSCTEIEEKLSTMEDRTTAVEADVEALKEQSEIHGSQLTDIMWKLVDYENRQRRNNLRFLGIEEGLDGNDIRA
ncbi:hypothetical protein NDU88_002483 [Pleurodeles waltl]|uniref:Uncharacterized protein n=1 Tax=Pleurodeles waltl TaxID=8319 RepID=A0AAV7T323_PLEWA|nr:hypothetical protein NDU88_002483 [Pleurodeles waltl]